jgi:hypothetical protein
MQNATLYWIKGSAPELSSLRGYALFRLTKIGKLQELHIERTHDHSA